MCIVVTAHAIMQFLARVHPEYHAMRKYRGMPDISAWTDHNAAIRQIAYEAKTWTEIKRLEKLVLPKEQNAEITAELLWRIANGGPNAPDECYDYYVRDPVKGFRTHRVRINHFGIVTVLPPDKPGPRRTPKVRPVVRRKHRDHFR